MPIKYKIVKQCNPGVKGGGPGRYYARACNRNKISLSEICQIISHQSSLSPADVVGVLYAFINNFADLLKDGNSIDLEPLGIFSVSIKSNGEDSVEKVSSRSIKGLQINFRPSVEFKKQMKNARFVKVN